MKVVMATQMLSQEDMAGIFLKAKRAKYEKFGSVRARLADPGEVFVTIIDGVEETRNVAKSGDVIIWGASDEYYVQPRSQFEKRYEDSHHLSSEWLSFKAKGTCFAFKWRRRPVTFTAPWGEKMILNTGDYLCSTGKTGKNAKGELDLYRIERDTFRKTYKLSE